MLVQRRVVNGFSGLGLGLGLGLRVRVRVRDSTLGAKKRYIFWDVMKNVLGIGIGLGLVIVLGIDNQS